MFFSTFRNSLALYSLSRLAAPLIRWKESPANNERKKTLQNNSVHEANQAAVQRPIRETVLYYVLWFTFHIYISSVCVRCVQRIEMRSVLADAAADISSSALTNICYCNRQHNTLCWS